MVIRRYRSLGLCYRRLGLLASALVAALALATAVLPAVASADLPSAPTVTGVSPNDGPLAGGTSTTIIGSNFTDAAAVKFISEFGEEPDASSFTVNSDTSITATPPPGAGVVDVTVIGPGGTSARTPDDRFGYGPIVERIEPRTGPAAGATAVTIFGLGLDSPTAVSFGSTPAASFSVNEDASITAQSPSFAGGFAAVPVTVNTPQGISTTPNRFADQLASNEFIYGPTVTNVEPDSGPAAGGTMITIRGTGFRINSLSPLMSPPVRVYFGSARFYCLPSAVIQCEVKSPTEITAVSPPGTGTVDVMVETSGGTNPSSPADQFAYDPLVREPNSSGPEAEILSKQALVNGNWSTKLLVRCLGQSGSDCSGSIGLSGIPHSIGSGKVRRYSSFRQFSLPAGSKRPIAIHLLPYVVPLLEEVHRLRVRAVINFARTENVEKPVVLRSRPAI